MIEQADPLAVALARRKRVMAPTYRLFYEEPLHVTRAQGVWMHDAAGKRYSMPTTTSQSWATATRTSWNA